MTSKSEIANTYYGDLQLKEWEDRWIRVEDAFQSHQPALRSKVGLIRAKLSGEIVYIFRATEFKKGGIEKGLQRIRGVPQTGNNGFGAQMMRRYADDLSVEILPIGENFEAAEISKKLKVAMVKYHDPDWCRPASRRIAKLRQGELK